MPKPSFGGMTASTRLPVVWPTSADDRPGSIWPEKRVGPPEEKVEPTSLAVAPLQS